MANSDAAVMHTLPGPTRLATLYGVLRLFVGLLKGAVIGGGVGYGAFAAGLSGGFNWLTYAVVGALVGLLVGRPIWSLIRSRSGTVWTAVLKAIFGGAVAVGLYALVAKAWGGFSLELIGGETRLVQDWPFLLGGAIGAIYGAFVELDDGGSEESEEPKRLPSQSK